MRKLVGFILIVLILSISPAHAHAKSYTVDQVQIKGWVQPDGDMLVNEVFTYSLDGSFSRLTRSFPEKHRDQIHLFEAYLVEGPERVVGEIEESALTKAEVTREGGTYVTALPADRKSVSVLYVYTLHKAVTSYDSYSDLSVTYFESGDNHDEDLHNVDISYVLPGDAGEDSVHGFLHDREGQLVKVYRDGITFHTPKSAAYTVTETRVLFPSTIMTGQQKFSAPESLEEAILKEQERIDKNDFRWANSPAAINVGNGLSLLFIALSIGLLLLRQSVFSLFGRPELILDSDPTYLAFVAHNGQFNRKSFLSGLFSLVEKGVVAPEIADSAARFQGQKGAPDKTLVFRLLQSNEQLKKLKQPLLPHEQYLVTWLFKGRVGHRKFHLHDIAGPSVRGDKKDRVHARKQWQFQKNHKNWHNDVLLLMEDAGALSTKVPKILRGAIFLLLTIMTMYGFYADGAGGWGIAFPAIIAVIGFYFYRSEPGKKWPAILFFVALFFVGAQIVSVEITNAILPAIICGAILFSATPRAMPSSLTALYTKMSITKFRRKIRRGIPDHLHSNDVDRWLVRAYLLNTSKKKLPKIPQKLTNASALAPMFSFQLDPLYFTFSTWSTPMTYNNGGSSSSGGSSYDSGGYIGGGGGGGDGGGGAGAD